MFKKPHRRTKQIKRQMITFRTKEVNKYLKRMKSKRESNKVQKFYKKWISFWKNASSILLSIYYNNSSQTTLHFYILFHTVLNINNKSKNTIFVTTC